MAKQQKVRNPGEEAILTLGLELLSVGLLTLIAGASNDVGTIVVIFMVGLWLIYIITNAKVIAGLEAGLAAA